MFYLKDSLGNTVRAIHWNEKNLIFVRRHDTGRIETTNDLKFYDTQKINYTILQTVTPAQFKKSSSVVVRNLGRHLTLVQDADNILKNINLSEDDPKFFRSILEKTGLASALVAALAIVITLLRPATPEPKKLEIVQVMDRQQIEKTIVVPPAEKKIAHVDRQIKQVQPRAQRALVAKKTAPVKAVGVLGVLGSLNKSKQTGGLKLDQSSASAGIGRGREGGSGGVQDSQYAKGLFAAPLGTGGKINGAGGYGTKGKGGGQAGYGKIQLVGQGGRNYFQPLENEASVDGGLDRNEIAAVIQRHLSEIRFCYEQGLQIKPRLSGRVAIRFLIGAKGLVTMSQVDQSSLGHAPVESCIRDRLKTWNFPKPEGGVTVKVTYPFILRRVSDT